MFSFILFFCYRGPPWKPLNVMGVSSLKINYYYYYYYYGHFAVVFAIFFCGIKKTGNSYFFRNLHLLSFPSIYSLRAFLWNGAHMNFFLGGQGRTPVKVRSNLNTIFVMLAYREHLIRSCESGYRNSQPRSHIPHSRIWTRNESRYPCYTAILRALSSVLLPSVR